ncbi:MAG: tetratricopeptide repeat protein [Opitutae bacterium]|nr:tetratricopeptide repeat protein [Opitutae bacterium]
MFRTLLFFLSLLALTGGAAEPALRDRANALFAGQKWAEAQGMLEKSIATEPQNAEAFYLLGRALLNQDKQEAAVSALEKATTLEPSNSEYFNRLGDAYGLTAQKAGLLSKMKWAGKCSAAYEKAIELDPKNIAARFSVLEYARQAPALVGGGMDKAYAQAAEIRKLDPALGRRAYATLYATDKKYDLAFAEYEEVLKAIPNDYGALFQTGRLAAISGARLERGVETLKQCLSVTPPNGQPGHDAVNWRLGMIFEKQGDKAAARALYETALKINPKFRQALESLKKLN